MTSTRLPADWASHPELLAGLTVDDDDERRRSGAALAGRQDGGYLARGLPLPRRMSRPSTSSEKRPLQIELVKLQNWVKATGQRLVIVFEGRDAAGKGGTINGSPST